MTDKFVTWLWAGWRYSSPLSGAHSGLSSPVTPWEDGESVPSEVNLLTCVLELLSDLKTNDNIKSSLDELEKHVGKLDKQMGEKM